MKSFKLVPVLNQSLVRDVIDAENCQSVLHLVRSYDDEPAGVIVALNKRNGLHCIMNCNTHARYNVVEQEDGFHVAQPSGIPKTFLYYNICDSIYDAAVTIALLTDIEN